MMVILVDFFATRPSGLFVNRASELSTTTIIILRLADNDDKYCLPFKARCYGIGSGNHGSQQDSHQLLVPKSVS